MTSPTKPVVVFDLETGGIRVGVPIIQIAAVVVDTSKGWEELGSWERKLQFKPEDCEPQALKVNRYTAKAWEGAVPLDQGLREFGRFLEKYRSIEVVSPRTGKPYQVTRVCGYNVRFDLDHIGAAFRAAGLFFPGQFNTALDVMQGVVWGQERGEIPATTNMKLTTVAEALGVQVPGDAHDALVDVRLTVGVARILLGGGK